MTYLSQVRQVKDLTSPASYNVAGHPVPRRGDEHHIPPKLIDLYSDPRGSTREMSAHTDTLTHSHTLTHSQTPTHTRVARAASERPPETRPLSTSAGPVRIRGFHPFESLGSNIRCWNLFFPDFFKARNGIEWWRL